MDNFNELFKFGTKKGLKMARAKGAVLGFLRGKLGQIVAKTREGRQYYASMPSKYTMSMKPYEVEKRDRFSVNGKIAGTIYKDVLLKDVWKISTVPANNGFNKITRTNFHFCGTDRPTVYNKITPPEGFTLPVINIESLPESIRVNLAAIELKGDEADIIFRMYISFFEPVNGAPTFFDFLKIENYETDGSAVTFPFNVREKSVAEMFRNKTVYFCAVTVDGNNRVMRFSQTVGKEL